MSESINTVSQGQVFAGAARSRGGGVSFQATTLKMAWRNMWRNWRRTAIALIAIILGLLLLLAMDGLIKGSDQAIFGNSVRLYGGNIQIHGPGFLEKSKRMPLIPVENADAVLDVVRAQPQVKSASKRINTGGMISSREGAYSVVITAIEPEQEVAHSLQAENIIAGRFLLPEDGDAVIIGKGLAQSLAVTVGDRVTLLGRSTHEMMRQRTMTIVGIFDLGMPDAEKGMAFITLAEAQTLYNLRDQATEITIVLNDVAQEAAVLSSLKASLSGYEIDGWDTLRPEMRETMDTKAGVTAAFSFIVLLIASIGILNLMLMAVFERTREMGVLASLGMKGRQIMVLFLVEGTLIGIVGAVIGCVIAMIIITLLGQVGIDMSFISGTGDMGALMGDRLYPALTWAQAAKQGVAVAVIAALATLYPAWQAARQEPAVALHHV